MQKLTRFFYNRNTLLVARELLGKHLVHRLPSGRILRGKIVDTEAYSGIYDPGSHTYHKKQKTERTQIWYGEGGYAYVYAIYGSYVCLGIITEPPGTPGAVLIRALEIVDGVDLLPATRSAKGIVEEGKSELMCAGPSKLCMAMGIDKGCNGLDLCGDVMFLEDAEGQFSIEDITFASRINIDYAGAGALSLWRYYVRSSPAIVKKTYEPLRDWRVKGYPGLQQQKPVDLFTHLAQNEACSMMSPDTIEMVKNLPKVELHLHLEGCMQLTTLRTLAVQNRVPLPVHLAGRASQYFSTFDEFAHAYHSICKALVHEKDFRFIIDDIAAYLLRNHVMYCEVTWTPFLYLNRGLSLQKIMAEMNQALEDHGIRDRVNFLIDVQRDHGIEAGTWIYEQAFALRNMNVVGIGLTGQEEGFPPSEYRALYQQAKDTGLGLTAHAGEYGSTEDIWQCVRDLQVSRVGHGIRAVEDRALLSYLTEQAIHLEVCPSSNVLLQRSMNYSSHPIQILRNHHVNLGINSDDPGIFGMEVTDEYLKVLEHCGFTFGDLKQSVVNSVSSSFAPLSQKHDLEQAVISWREGNSEKNVQATKTMQ